MKLINLYIEEDVKQKALEKVSHCMPEGVELKKGTFSALVRVLLQRFVDLDNEVTEKFITDKVLDDYTVYTTKNKRSKL